MESEEKYPEGYIEFLSNQKKVIEEIAMEDFKEDSIDSVDSIQNRIELMKRQTEGSKKGFINEIKSGLGDEIKTNPNKVIYVKKPFHIRIFNKIKNFFR
jgi:hypothetical protein